MYVAVIVFVVSLSVFFRYFFGGVAKSSDLACLQKVIIFKVIVLEKSNVLHILEQSKLVEIFIGVCFNLCLFFYMFR